MGRKLQQDEIYQRMVKILKAGPTSRSYLISLLREEFEITRQALEDRIIKWNEKKIIQVQGKNVRLLNPHANKHIHAKAITTTRQENYRLKYLLKDPLKPSDPPIVIKSAGFQAWLPPITPPTPNTAAQATPSQAADAVRPKRHSLNNHEQQSFIIEGYTARLNTSSLEIWCPHIYADSKTPSIIMEDEAKRLLDGIALKIEERLQEHVSFKLVRLNKTKDVLYSERVDIEVEEENHSFAAAKPDDYKFEVHHPLDGKLRAKVDFSRGKDFPEMAFMHRSDAGIDRDTMNHQFNALFDGKVSLLDIPEIKALMSSQAQISYKTDEQLAKYAEALNMHLPVLKGFQDREIRQKEIDAKLSAVLDAMLDLYPKKAAKYVRLLNDKQGKLIL